MCSNVEKARYLKLLIEEIRAAAAQRRARKAARAIPAPKLAQPALAAYRK